MKSTVRKQQMWNSPPPKHLSRKYRSTRSPPSRRRRSKFGIRIVTTMPVDAPNANVAGRRIAATRFPNRAPIPSLWPPMPHPSLKLRQPDRKRSPPNDSVRISAAAAIGTARTQARITAGPRASPGRGDRGFQAKGGGERRHERDRDARRGDRPFASTEKPAPRERQPDPNSPFAKLLALKDELERRAKKETP